MSENLSDPRHPAVATDAEVATLDSLVTMYVEAARGIAAFEAMKVQVLAGLSALADQQRDRLPVKRAVRELPLREIAAEVALAVRVSDRVMQGMITDAATTVELFPAAVTALAEGRVSRGHVTALVDAGAAIDDAAAREAFEVAALEVAERESVGRFRAVVQGMAERANPRSMAERHLLAREDRGTRVRELPDGMATSAHSAEDTTSSNTDPAGKSNSSPADASNGPPPPGGPTSTTRHRVPRTCPSRVRNVTGSTSPRSAAPSRTRRPTSCADTARPTSGTRTGTRTGTGPKAATQA